MGIHRFEVFICKIRKAIKVSSYINLLSRIYLTLTSDFLLINVCNCWPKHQFIKSLLCLNVVVIWSCWWTRFFDGKTEYQWLLLLFFWNLLKFFMIPYVFWHASSPTVFVLQKPFKYQNVQLFKDITACIFLFSTFYTFGNIQLFLQNFAHSSLWGFFQISFSYNFSIRSAIETIQLLKHSAF